MVQMVVLKAAINAMLAARIPHHFLGINLDGLASIITTTGNPDGHLVLRGGADGPNYQSQHIESAAKTLKNKALNNRLIVDCSHGNSNKDYNQQPIVLDNIAQQIEAGKDNIIGVMIESHLIAGNQSLSDRRNSLTYGQSITDACVNWETTKQMLRSLAKSVAKGRPEYSSVNQVIC